MPVPATVMMVPGGGGFSAARSGRETKRAVSANATRVASPRRTFVLIPFRLRVTIISFLWPAIRGRRCGLTEFPRVAEGEPAFCRLAAARLSVGRRQRDYLLARGWVRGAACQPAPISRCADTAVDGPS